MKNIKDFYMKIFSFLEVKFSIYLNRRVFVMRHRNICLAKGLVRIFIEVVGLNLMGGGIQLMTANHFFAQSLPLSPFHYPNMAEIQGPVVQS